jgi:hypothetical protein
MFKQLMLAAVVGLGGLAATQAIAEPFQGKQVPSEAKWVLHIDADALMKSAIWPTVQDRLLNRNPAIAGKMSEIESASGIAIPDDIHSVTIYGMGFEDGDAVVLLQLSNINQAHLTQLLQGNPSFATEKYNGHDLLAWDDHGKTKFGGFFGADRALIGDRKENVQKAFDALDAKGDGFVSPATQPANATLLAMLASDSVGHLARKDPKNPVFKQLRSVWFTAAADQQNLILHGSGTAQNAKGAQLLKAVADGLKAFGILMAENENVDPRVKLLAPLLPGLTISSEGQNVLLDWTASIDQLKTAADGADAQHKARQEKSKAN